MLLYFPISFHHHVIFTPYLFILYHSVPLFSSTVLITHLAAAESRCAKLERQLDHMRRMLRNAKADRTSLLKQQVNQRSVVSLAEIQMLIQKYPCINAMFLRKWLVSVHVGLQLTIHFIVEYFLTINVMIIIILYRFVYKISEKEK